MNRRKVKKPRRTAVKRTPDAAEKREALSRSLWVTGPSVPCGLADQPKCMTE